jgi:hypothetical protein
MKPHPSHRPTHLPITAQSPLLTPLGPVPAPFQPPAPSLPTLANNAAAAAARALRAAVAGRPLTVPLATQEARMAICLTCPGGWWQPDRKRCFHPQCGCFGAPKASLSTETCPAGYWP